MKTTAHSTFKVGDNDEFLYENLFTKKELHFGERCTEYLLRNETDPGEYCYVMGYWGENVQRNRIAIVLCDIHTLNAAL